MLMRYGMIYRRTQLIDVATSTSSRRNEFNNFIKNQHNKQPRSKWNCIITKWLKGILPDVKCTDILQTKPTSIDSKIFKLQLEMITIATTTTSKRRCCDCISLRVSPRIIEKKPKVSTCQSR